MLSTLLPLLERHCLLEEAWEVVRVALQAECVTLIFWGLWDHVFRSVSRENLGHMHSGNWQTEEQKLLGSVMQVHYDICFASKQEGRLVKSN